MASLVTVVIAAAAVLTLVARVLLTAVVATVVVATVAMVIVVTVAVVLRLAAVLPLRLVPPRPAKPLRAAVLGAAPSCGSGAAPVEPSPGCSRLPRLRVPDFGKSEVCFGKPLLLG